MTPLEDKVAGLGAGIYVIVTWYIFTLLQGCAESKRLKRGGNNLNLSINKHLFSFCYGVQCALMNTPQMYSSEREFNKVHSPWPCTACPLLFFLRLNIIPKVCVCVWTEAWFNMLITLALCPSVVSVFWPVAETPWHSPTHKRRQAGLFVQSSVLLLGLRGGGEVGKERCWFRNMFGITLVTRLYNCYKIKLCVQLIPGRHTAILLIVPFCEICHVMMHAWMNIGLLSHLC